MENDYGRYLPLKRGRDIRNKHDLDLLFNVQFYLEKNVSLP